MQVTDTVNIGGQKWHDFLTRLDREFETHQNAELALARAYRTVCPNSDLAVGILPGIYIIGNEYDLQNKYLRERFIGRLVRIRKDTVYFFPGEALHFDGKRMSVVFCGIAIWNQQHLMIWGCEGSVACYALDYRGECIFYYTHGASHGEDGEKFLIGESMLKKIKDFLVQV